MKSKIGIADAFGTLVEVGDTVVYKGKQKYLEKGQVTKVTPKGVTVDHKVNIRSERIYMADKGMQSLFDGECGDCVVPFCDENTGDTPFLLCSPGVVKLKPSQISPKACRPNPFVTEEDN